MSTKKASLVCNYEAAKSIRAEYPKRQNEELVLTGAFWQQVRIATHLSEKLSQSQAELAGLLKASSQAAEANNGVDPILATRSYLRGKLEGQIELLESLSAQLG